MPDKKEVTDMISKIESEILRHDSLLISSEKGRSDLENSKQKSLLSVVEHHNKIQAKLTERKDQVMADITASFEKQIEKLHKTETLNLKGIQLMNDRARLHVTLQDQSKLATIDLDAIREKLFTDEDTEFDTQNLKLTFCPTIKLTKLKKVDFGFLQVSDLLPDDLTLVLKTPIDSINFGSKVTCTVLSNKEFTKTNQDHITFAIKNKSSSVKETVSFVKEDCGVSEDKKKFDITFRVYRPGTYAVTVYLYREVHITNSPMSIPLDNLPTQQHQQPSLIPDDLASALGDMTLNKGLNRSLRRPHSHIPAPISLKPPVAFTGQLAALPPPHTPNSPSVTDLHLQPATPKTPAGVVLNNLFKPTEKQPLTPFTEASNNLMGLLGSSL